MVKDLFRIIGSACVIAGAMLYIVPTTNQDNPDENTLLKAEVTALESELAKTSKELANLQLAIKEAEQPAEEEQQEEKKEDSVEDSSSEQEQASMDKPILVIKPGMNSTTVADELAKAGIVEDASAFEFYLAKTELAGKIQIGEYELETSMSYEKIVDIITSSN